MTADRRLIEDYLPIQAISAEASREKSVRKGHISTLHLWWARRPLVACRAAVYGALVPADRSRMSTGESAVRPGRGAATGRGEAYPQPGGGREFRERLCKYPGDPKVIAVAQRHILEAHAERLTQETGKPVTVEDIEAGRAPGRRCWTCSQAAAPSRSEALRLGCEAYALDLNPVAHIIQLCTLVYPQKYGKPDPTVRGMTGTENDAARRPGAAWPRRSATGAWLLEKAKAEIGDLYPLIPDPSAPQKPFMGENCLPGMGPEGVLMVPGGFLTPVAYLYTRTVTCKNPTCKATVPLVRQTWLCKKDGRYVALKEVAPRGKRRVRFEVVHSTTEKALGFDPAGFSKAGNATCPYCGSVADSDFVKEEGRAGRIGTQPMAVVCTRPGARGKVYFSADDLGSELLPDDKACRHRIAELCKCTGLTVPDEPINNDAKNANFCILYGLDQFSKLFTPRQMLSLLTFVTAVREAYQAMIAGPNSITPDYAKAVATLLAAIVDRIADWNSSLCSWSPENTGGAKIGHTFGRQALPMIWDFAESGIWGDATGSAEMSMHWVLQGIEHACVSYDSPSVSRGSATHLPWPDGLFDVLITDPP